MELTREQKIRRYESTAKFHKQKADREWAYAKNGQGGEHYGIAKRHYNKAKKYQETADRLKMESV